MVIGMYYKDHNPPHFHAYYGEHDAAIWSRMARSCGYLPRRAMAHVKSGDRHTSRSWKRNGSELEPTSRWSGLNLWSRYAETC